jgi:hypothetical protein
MGGKSGGKKGVCMGGKMACCVLGGRKKREERKKKTKEKTGRLLVVGWGRKKTERGKKKKKKPHCVRGWVHGEEKNIYIAGRRYGVRGRRGKKNILPARWLYGRPGKKNNKMEFKILKYGRQYRLATHSVFSSQLFFFLLFFLSFVLLSHQPHTQVFSFSAFFSSLFFSPQLFLLSRRYPLSPEDQTRDPTPPELQSR